MRKTLSMTLGTLLIAALLAPGCKAMPGGEKRDGAETLRPGDPHIMLSSDEIEWQPGPASLEEGAEFAVLEGDPGEPGPVTMRLRLPDGFVIAPHHHPRPERVTVLEGTFRFAMESEFDPAAAEPLPAGSFFVMPPGMHHFAIAEGETVIQLNVQGPWEIVYLDPADDPRER